MRRAAPRRKKRRRSAARSRLPAEAWGDPLLRTGVGVISVFFLMRRRTQIVLAITFMVAALVCGASYLYISQILRQRISTAHETAMYLASQVAFLANNAAP